MIHLEEGRVTEETQEAVELQLLRFANRLTTIGLSIFLALVIFGVTSIFGAGVFFARTDTRLAHVESGMGRIESVIISDFGTRLRRVEQQVDRGVLSEADKRLDRLEQKVFNQ